MAFANTVLAYDLLQTGLPAELEDWIDRLFLAAAKVRAGHNDPGIWQLEMDHLYKSADLNALMAHIDMDKLKRRIDYGDRGECFLTTPLRDMPKNAIDDDVPLQIVTKFASVKKGSSVPPHGHANMVSAFLLISGRMQARQFDRVGWDKANQTLVVKQNLGEIQGRGQWTSISDVRSNCHWLTALTDDCYFFSTKLVDIDPQVKTFGRIPFHYEAGSDLGSGLRKVPIISGRRAAEIYGD